MEWSQCSDPILGPSLSDQSHFHGHACIENGKCLAVGSNVFIFSSIGCLFGCAIPVLNSINLC